jgi:ABC-type lipoprotein export system ATPase subunit
MTKNDDAAKTSPPAFHKIKSVEVSGGFLQGVALSFADSLNCIIGGRGTGKTSVLEAIRYALDRMPDQNVDRKRYDAIEDLLEHTVGSGTIRVKLETGDGVVYEVARGIGEAPLVTDANGAPSKISIGRDIVFGVDLYSQNQIEAIANDSYSQLQLIDKFIRSEVDGIESQLRELTQELGANAAKVLEARREIADLTDATRELPDVAEKIAAFERAEGGGEDEVLRNARESRTKRIQEAHVFDAAAAAFPGVLDAVGRLAHDVRRQFEGVFDVDVTGSPNFALVEQARESVRRTVAEIERHFDGIRAQLRATGASFSPIREKLQEQHSLQDKAYRELTEKHERERVRGVERTRLEQRHLDLKSKEKRLAERREDLVELERSRDTHRARISELRDRRFQLRLDVTERLNRQLAPMIRVRLEQFGNMDEYRNLLNQSMKGSGMRYASIVERAVERIPPPELAAMIQRDDRAGLERELDIDADRATRLIIQLKDKPELFAIETVELRDRPVIELKDGDDYKDSSALSTGQKCTTVLPILLVESEHPLLIDQPEDNLDNAFVFETIVKSLAEVRGRRQLIFVTHNPNIPVLGDAERVFALRSTGRAATVAKAGTVDDVATEIITILEGGRAAFEARRKRYGRPLPGRMP